MISRFGILLPIALTLASCYTVPFSRDRERAVQESGQWQDGTYVGRVVLEGTVAHHAGGGARGIQWPSGYVLDEHTWIVRPPEVGGEVIYLSLDSLQAKGDGPYVHDKRIIDSLYVGQRVRVVAGKAQRVRIPGDPQSSIPWVWYLTLDIQSLEVKRKKVEIFPGPSIVEGTVTYHKPRMGGPVEQQHIDTGGFLLIDCRWISQPPASGPGAIFLGYKGMYRSSRGDIDSTYLGKLVRVVGTATKVTTPGTPWQWGTSRTTIDADSIRVIQ